MRYIIINIITGNINGFYNSDTWEFDEVLNLLREDEEIVKISFELWQALMNKNENIALNNPTINVNKITDFLNIDLINIPDLESFCLEFFIEREVTVEPNEISQEQKDIKFLAETLKSFIEPMALPSDGQANPALKRLQEIINRYSN